MAAAGFDEDCVAGPHGVQFAVEFHFAFAFEDVINLGQLWVWQNRLAQFGEVG